MDTILLAQPTPSPTAPSPRAALEALSAAKALGGARDRRALRRRRSRRPPPRLAGTGVAKVLAVEDAAFAEPRYATDAAAAAALAKASGATHRRRARPPRAWPASWPASRSGSAARSTRT